MRKIRADSAEAAINAMVNAAKGPRDVPAHVRLRKADRPFWDGVMKARAWDEWTPADLVVAAQLARCQRDIEIESRRSEEHRRPELIDRLIKMQLAMMRALRMGGKAAGDPRDEAFRRVAERQAEQVLGELKDDELLAS